MWVKRSQCVDRFLFSSLSWHEWWVCCFSGRVVEEQQSLMELGVRPHGSTRMEMSSTDPATHPLRPLRPPEHDNMPDVITVRVQTGVNTLSSVLSSTNCMCVSAGCSGPNTIYTLQNDDGLELSVKWLSLTSRWGRVPGGGGGDWACPPAEGLPGRLQTPADGGGVPPRCCPDPTQEETWERSGGLQPRHTGKAQSFKTKISRKNIRL